MGLCKTPLQTSLSSLSVVLVIWNFAQVFQWKCLQIDVILYSSLSTIPNFMLKMTSCWLCVREYQCVNIIIFANFTIRTFKPHAMYTTTVGTCAKFKSLAWLKVKIEKFEVSQNPILTSLIYHWILWCQSVQNSTAFCNNGSRDPPILKFNTWDFVNTRNGYRKKLLDGKACRPAI